MNIGKYHFIRHYVLTITNNNSGELTKST